MLKFMDALLKIPLENRYVICYLNGTFGIYLYVMCNHNAMVLQTHSSKITSKFQQSPKCYLYDDEREL